MHLDGIEPSDQANELAADEDARRLEVILRESRRIVRARPPLVIAETRHGFVCASAGVDQSNVRGLDTLVLLPVDPDASARRLCERIRELTGKNVAVIVSDSFGRPFRRGTTDVALGVSGMAPLLDLKGRHDSSGYVLHATEIAVADEIAGAAELVTGKTRGIPSAIVRGLNATGEAGKICSCPLSAICSDNGQASRLDPCAGMRSGEPRPPRSRGMGQRDRHAIRARRLRASGGRQRRRLRPEHVRRG